MVLLLLALAASVALVHAIPIDNGLVGDPEVQCGPSSVTISFNTRNGFEGNIYVKNFFADDGCKVTGDGRSQTNGIDVGFESCNSVRRRSLEPRGIFVSNTVIISFHPIFLTKIDRAIRIQCFYMEADKTVSQELEVSMITTVLQTLTVPMPVCRYDILDNDANGAPIRFTIIGQQVYHKWTCDTDTVDTFCMTVTDCFVDDGTGDVVTLLNEDGCALDRNLLDNLDYPTDLIAGKEAHVFKYADRANLYFNCQIRIVVKEPGVDCARPQCPLPPRGKRAAVSKRMAGRLDQTPAVIQDVAPQYAILVADVDLTEDDVPATLIHPLVSHNEVAQSFERFARQPPRSDGFCVGPSSLGLLTAVGIVCLVATTALGALLYTRRSGSKF